jgi:hypothetical protein
LPEHQTWYTVRYHPSAVEVGLPPDREFVFAGFFLAWLALNDLLSTEFVQLVGSETIGAVKSRRLSGPQLLAGIDGIVESGMVTEDGYGFASNYFDLVNGGQYLSDFRAQFGIRGSRSEDLYQVEDHWENYDLIAARIDAAYAAWPR